MSTEVRPPLSAGIAALSVSAIVAAAITTAPQHVTTMTLPELPGISSSVELASVVNPLSAIDTALQTTVTNVQQFISGLSANALITALIGSSNLNTIKQLVSAGQTALTNFGDSLSEDLSPEAQNVVQLVEAGNWKSALTAVESTATSIQTVPTVVLQAVLLGSVSQLLQTVTPGITSLQSALKSGNLLGALSAVATITKNVVSAVLGQSGLVSQLLAIAQTLNQAGTTAATAAAKAAATTTAAAAVPLVAAKSVIVPAAATAAAVATTSSTAAATSTAASKPAREHGRKPTVAATTAGDSTTASSASADAAAPGATASANTKSGKSTHAKGSHNQKAGDSSGSHASRSHGAK